MQVDAQTWRFRRIDIRSPLSSRTWPIARLELEHPVRGRVTDIGTAPGALDAAFSAASNILHVAPRLAAFNVTSAAPAGGTLALHVELDLELDGAVWRGSSAGADLVECAVTAWLAAAARACPAAA